ncbi:glycoside hydrolase family 16 protein [Fistulina hepatica ATCC 64428]|uniref:Glycoside hydrolase family 16 protein n=1 Tax=Fistulina hepatica ATCC 64428 TaxID=1128425 RepID=A0A0D7A542_9AGAR|nr:glycoside hydrolase family 16 protein [Fistulina hepatica ATCC 64428]
MLDPAGSTTSLALPGPKPPMPSNLLEHKLDTEDKPWMRGSDRRQKISWWLTLCGILLGALGAAAVCYLGYTSVYVLPAQYTCKLLLDEDFSGSTLNTDTWHYDVELGGFNDGEFEITTDNDTNVFIKNNQLYIKPTLTSDVLSGGYSALFDGGSYDLGSSCSTSNTTACSVTADNSTGTVVNPVMSGRLTTRGLVSMQYGRIEVRAKLPRGDWLWPSIWMLPENDADEDENWSGDYGDWPLSGEIDIMSSRGNGVNYKGRGCNYVQGALTYGVMDSLIETLYGWWSLKQSTYADDFHTYAIEWDPDFMRFYTDTRLDDILTVVTKTEKQSFWTRGSFPEVTQNGSSEVVVVNPWKNDGYNAPFNKPFYLIIDLAVGGTNGWFPDNEGGKPWYDGSSSAMYDFAKAQDTWYANWPTDEDDLSFRIDSVKMWTTC